MTQPDPDEGQKGADPVQPAPEPTPEPAPENRGNRPEGRSRIAQRDTGRRADVALDNRKEPEPWERDDAPKGSTASSLLTTDENGKVRVSGPTHYTHLADGRIVPTYGIGTHHTDADEDDGEPVAVVAHY